MGDIDRVLADLLIERSIDLARLEASVRNKILALLMDMQREIKAKLASADELTEFGKQRLNALMKESSAVIDDYHKQARAEVEETLGGLVRLEAEQTAVLIDDAFQQTVKVAIGAGLPSETRLKTLVSDALIQGAPSKDWWSRQSQSTAFNFSQAVRQGIAQGETNAQIIARVVGKKGVPGIMEVSRRNAAALVHTSVQTVANEARMATFEANVDVIANLAWITALDSHVCGQCLPRAGLAWDMDRKPIGHNIQFRNPPIHFGDRCLLVPRTRSFAEMGIDLPEPTRTTRASDEGPIDANITFAQFLERKSKAYQDELLGPGRADLWRRKVITLQNLIDQSGRELSLAELKAKYAR